MYLRTPSWWRASSWQSLLLQPFSFLYGLNIRLRARYARPYQLPVPVICVGNITVGGTGKTPVVISLAQLLISLNINVHCISRGYGGSLKGPLQVNMHSHSAAEVGDEPLLLARYLPVWIGADRKAAATAAINAGAQVLLMDDGFQNFSICKTMSLLVMDGNLGIGNGLLLPAGPLRESVESGMKRAQAVICMGEDRAGIHPLAASYHLSCLEAHIQPEESEKFKQHRWIAFAGIGYPDKFFTGLKQLGLTLVQTIPFPDHYPYKETDLQRLVEQATLHGAKLLTTEKDWVRIPSAFKAQIEVLRVHVSWEDEKKITQLLGTILSLPQASTIAKGAPIQGS